MYIDIRILNDDGEPVGDRFSNQFVSEFVGRAVYEKIVDILEGEK